ncbi:MAG: S-layer protein [Methanomicrobiaceae archaeon]|nr:S-layer protein [Methanomicrobiaceae archaeon]
MQFRHFLVLALAVGMLVVPAMAGDKYLYGSPDLTASISGTNEFSPGDEVVVTVKLENQGLNVVKIAQSSIIESEDQPNTAKLVAVTLKEGVAPITIKTDRQKVGDIAGGSSTTVSFTVKFDADASPGTYMAPLVIEYIYLSSADQFGTDTITYRYLSKTVEIPLNLRVTSEVSLDISDIRTRYLNVGTEGYLTLNIMNKGFEDARHAVVKIARNGNSPLVPTDSSVYVGDFPSGAVTEPTFKIAVSSDAEEEVYPLNVYVEYEDSAGDVVTSDTKTIGIGVGGKIDFEVISAPSEVSPGEKAVIEVVFRNSGAATVYKAQARISAVDPFSSNDDTAFLGDIAPGETVKARFVLTTDAAATIKSYGLDSEIRYRDALDNSQISETMKVVVNVVSPSGAMTALSNPLVIGIIIVGIIGAGYYLVSLRNKK